MAVWVRIPSEVQIIKYMKLKITYLRKLILSKEYPFRRLNDIHNQMMYWKNNYNRATTQKERDFCKEMVSMYLKRYIHYL